MSSNHGQVKRDYIGGTLNIAGKEIVDRRANVCGNNGKFKGDFQIKGDLTIGGDILGSTEPIHITQQKMDDAGGNLTLSESGPYSFVEDITGVITVGADCICLNLNCHTFDAGGLINGIVISDRKDIIIMNGCITGTLGGSSSEILVTGSTNVKLINLNFDGAGVGERVIFFNNVTNLSMDEFNVTNYISTNTSVIQFDNCNIITMKNINIFNCTKTLAAQSGVFPDALFNQNVSFLCLSSCKNFTLNKINVNNNTSNSAQITNMVIGIHLLLSENGQLSQCDVNNNIIINGSYPGAALIGVILCKNVSINKSQTNNNNFDGPVNLVFATAAFLSSGVIIDECQVNENIISELSSTDVAAFDGFAFSNSVSCTICNCQVINNLIINAGIRTSWPTGSYINGISVFENMNVDNCQVYGLVTQTIGPYIQVSGIAILRLNEGSNIITNSSFNNNSGGEYTQGILIDTSDVTGAPTTTTNIKIINCTANSNRKYGLLVGFPDNIPVPGFVKQLEIIDCIFNNNGVGNTGDSAGINFLQFISPVTNVLIKSCSINNTFADSGNATGINIMTATNVDIEDTIVNNTNAIGNGHAIVLNGITNLTVENCKLNGNKNSGIKLLGICNNLSISNCKIMENDIGIDFDATSTITNSTVQSCQASNNATVGFNYGPLIADVSFISNKAQGNGTNFAIASGVINLQQLTLGTGTYTSISGAGSVLGSSLSNLQIVP